MIIKNLRFFSLILIGLLSGVYVVWQLIGLRYTNHDDIFFNLYSFIFTQEYLEFSKIAALKLARLQAYINMPLILWANKFVPFVTFDFINFGAFAFLYGTLILFLSKLSKLEDSIRIASVTALLFPLHYYFTFPQGYPLMAPWSLAFAFLSSYLLISHLLLANKLKLYLSVLFFALSLWGPEYNFILHPIFLLIVFFYYSRSSKALTIFLPYFFMWLINVTTYLLYSFHAKSVGADSIGRVSLSLDFDSWIKTFILLQEKSFLPVSLIRGIIIGVASKQGVPEIPNVLSYQTMWEANNDKFSIIVIFLIGLIIFSVLLGYQQVSKSTIRKLLLLFTSILLIPGLILSASSHYHLIVLQGNLQGHLVTFYSQIGFSSILFLSMLYVISSVKNLRVRFFLTTLFSISLASIYTLTFVYNNINRQVMMANKQKWEAFDNLAEYITVSRPELKDKNLYAPDFWSGSGVSTIPDQSLWAEKNHNKENYWVLYSENVINKKILVSPEQSIIDANKIIINYVANSEGSSVTTMIEDLGELNCKITLISRSPISGDLEIPEKNLKIKPNNWSCSNLCTIILEETFNDKFEYKTRISFRSVNKGPKLFLSQFLLPRQAQFAHLF